MPLEVAVELLAALRGRVRLAPGRVLISDRDALIDAAYDDGALGVTVMAQG